MMTIDEQLSAESLLPKIKHLWELAAGKIRAVDASCPPGTASPVFTRAGKYTAQGWTEWTQGFQYGSAILQFDATGDEEFLALGRRRTRELMASHVTHFGVHDHGFNNVSTYGNLRRLMLEGRISQNPWELDFYEMALKCSGAVQANRWTEIPIGGFIYSFNGPHSLFSDTIRSCRALALSHHLGHELLGEKDVHVSLLDRLLDHAAATSMYNVCHGEERDAYDVRGRVAHESIFNLNNGSFRCLSSQQGYSPFTTWTRGLAWIMLGYPEQLEFFDTVADDELETHGGREVVTDGMLKTAEAVCDFYLNETPTDGIPYWDTGAPGLHHLGDFQDRPAEPFNDHEPVDSSAAAIACQGLLRLGHYLKTHGKSETGQRYWQAGLTVLNRLLEEPYLSTDPKHEGIILHSVYHRPNDWDYIPDGQRVPCGESSMWGDYHALEAALYVQRVATEKPYYTFWGNAK